MENVREAMVEAEGKAAQRARRLASIERGGVPDMEFEFAFMQFFWSGVGEAARALGNQELTRVAINRLTEIIEAGRQQPAAEYDDQEGR